MIQMRNSVSPPKTAALMEMPFESRTRVGPRNHGLDGGSDPPWEGAILRGKRAACCTTAEPMK